MSDTRDLAQPALRPMPMMQRRFVSKSSRLKCSCQCRDAYRRCQSEDFFHERRSFLRREGKLKLENLKSKIKYRELKWAVLQDSRKENVAIREDSSTDTSENE